jgi:hypothetical protein
MGSKFAIAKQDSNAQVSAGAIVAASAPAVNPAHSKRPMSQPEPRETLADPALIQRYRPHLLAIYEELSPGDVPRVDEVLNHFLAMDNGVQKLNDRLMTKYGRRIDLNNVV